MVKVENKETLRLLTKRFMKMNRARNIIAVIAIMLTSLLFTSLFVGSVSMILSKRATEIKQSMDSSHAIAQNLSEEDAERLTKNNRNKVMRWNDMEQAFFWEQEEINILAFQ